jgi:hypothetical protein
MELALAYTERSEVPNIVLDFFTKRCDPPGPEGEVKRQLERARKECEPRWLAEREEAAAKWAAAAAKEAAAQLEEHKRALRVEIKDIKAEFEAESPEMLMDTASGEGRIFAVDRFIEQGELLSVVGPEKAQKTSFLIHLSVCMATGRPVLGNFRVLQPRPVLYGIFEGSPQARLDIATRVCKSMGMEYADLEGRFEFMSRAPFLCEFERIERLAKQVRVEDVGLLIYEPLYLCGGPDAHAADTDKIGLMIKHLLDCVPSTCTVAIGHHFNKGARKREKMELSDFNYAALSRACGQWVMMTHRQPFDWINGRTWLRMEFGGRAGQGGELDVDIDEGPLDAKNQRAKWDFSCRPLGESPAEQTTSPIPESKNEPAIVQLDSTCHDQVVITAQSNLARKSRDGIVGFTQLRTEVMKMKKVPAREVRLSVDRLLATGIFENADYPYRAGRFKRIGQGLRRK